MVLGNQSNSMTLMPRCCDSTFARSIAGTSTAMPKKDCYRPLLFLYEWRVPIGEGTRRRFREAPWSLVFGLCVGTMCLEVGVLSLQLAL